jgi:hypothetical protein
MTATPRDSAAGASTAISRAPAGPSMLDFKVWEFTTRSSCQVVGGSGHALLRYENNSCSRTYYLG